MAAVTALAWDTGFQTKECDVANLALARLGADLIKDDTENTPSARAAKAIFAATRDELLRDYEFSFAWKQYRLAKDEEVAYSGIQTTSGSVVLVGFSGLVQDALAGSVVLGDGIPEDNHVVSNTETTVSMVSQSTKTGTIDATISRTGLRGAWSNAYVLPTSPVILKVLEINNDPEAAFEVFGYAAYRRVLCNVGTAGSDPIEAKCVVQTIDPAYWDPLFRDAFVLRLASKLAIPLVKREDMVAFLQSEFSAVVTMAKNASSRERNSDSGVPLWTAR